MALATGRSIGGSRSDSDRAQKTKSFHCKCESQQGLLPSIGPTTTFCREACAELSRAKSTAAAIGAWTMRKSDSRCRNRARPRRAGLLAVSKFEKHSWRRGAPLHPSEQDDFALSLTLSQIGGDPTTVRNEAMNAVTFAGGSASALST